MAITMAIANHKGGVGKTTTTINLGVGLVREGKKVLLVDCDSSANLTTGLGYPKTLRESLEAAMKAALYGMEYDVHDAILHHQTEGVDVLPSNKTLAGMEGILLLTPNEPERALMKALAPIQGEYDYILLDCPPSLGMLTINVMTAADKIIIAVQPQFYSAAGLEDMLFTIMAIKRQHNPSLKIEGIVYTIDTERECNTKQAKKEIAEKFGQAIPIMKTTIPRYAAIAATSKSSVSIFSLHRKGDDGVKKGARAYEDLAKEVLSNE